MKATIALLLIILHLTHNFANAYRIISALSSLVQHQKCEINADCKKADYKCDHGVCVPADYHVRHNISTAEARRGLFLGVFARASYTDLELVDELQYLCKHHFQPQKNIFFTAAKPFSVLAEQKSVEGYTFVVYSNKKYDVLSFKGTTTLQEGLRDLDIRLTDFSPVSGFGQVHNGFLQVFKKMLPDLDRVFANRTKPLLITGHSLGAALAVYSGVHLSRNKDIKIKAIYTFGSPKLGDEDFVNAFGNLVREKKVDVQRYVNRNPGKKNQDPVTLLPPGKLFQHVIAKPIILECRDKKAIEKSALKNGTEEYGECSDRRLHSMPLYIDALKRRIKKSWLYKECGNFDMFNIPFL